MKMGAGYPETQFAHPAPSSGAGALLIARKEAGELLLSARGLSWLLVVAIVLSGFALLLVGDTELGLLDNAQVVYDMVGVAIAVGALIAVVAGIDAIGGERERGSLVPLLLAPLPRAALFLGKLGGLLVTWMAMFAVTLPYLWAVGSTGQNLGAGVVALAVLGTPVVLAFGAFALGLGARLGSVAGALAAALTVLVLSASPLVIGPGLRRTAIGAAFDLVNPFSAALNAVDAIVIDSEPLIAQVAALSVTVAWALVAIWFAWTGMRRLAR
jgi:ABC-type transport system involved in multi-copper enzyme maturation permease subunit